MKKIYIADDMFAYLENPKGRGSFGGKSVNLNMQAIVLAQKHREMFPFTIVMKALY